MEERDKREEDAATSGPGRQGPGRDSAPDAAGEPLSDDDSQKGTSTGTPGKTHEPGVGGPNEAPRRQQPGL
jgi:hypothetical protein